MGSLRRFLFRASGLFREDALRGAFRAADFYLHERRTCDLRFFSFFDNHTGSSTETRAASAAKASLVPVTTASDF